MNKIHVLEIRIDPQWLEAVANRCFEIGFTGVETFEEDSLGCIRTYCNTKTEAKELAKKIKEYLSNLSKLWPKSPPFHISIGLIENDDWANAWKASFKPTEIIENLVVRPSWELYVPKKQEIVITIDPKMAFGTGKHETTTLALEAIKRFHENFDFDDSMLLDIGCGTGILGLAANYMGFPRTLGIDIDPEAINCAVENAKMNRLADRSIFVNTSIEHVAGLFDFIVANIDAQTLIAIAPEIQRVFSEAGCVALTGILETQSQMVEDAYQKSGFCTTDYYQRGEWVLLEMELETEDS